MGQMCGAAEAEPESTPARKQRPIAAGGRPAAGDAGSDDPRCAPRCPCFTDFVSAGEGHAHVRFRFEHPHRWWVTRDAPAESAAEGDGVINFKIRDGDEDAQGPHIDLVVEAVDPEQQRFDSAEAFIEDATQETRREFQNMFDEINDINTGEPPRPVDGSSPFAQYYLHVARPVLPADGSPEWEPSPPPAAEAEGGEGDSEFTTTQPQIPLTDSGSPPQRESPLRDRRVHASPGTPHTGGEGSGLPPSTELHFWCCACLRGGFTWAFQVAGEPGLQFNAMLDAAARIAGSLIVAAEPREHSGVARGGASRVPGAA